MKQFYLIFLLFLVACGPAARLNTPPADSKTFDLDSCSVDLDCVCGGIDKNTGDCFVGNKNYYNSGLVDKSRNCPDFCTGIAGHLETRCMSGKCRNVQRDSPAIVACSADAKVCSDGSSVGRVPPDCKFAPCPVVEEQKVDLASAHWQCEDGSWRENAEQCFENVCVSKDDCQILGLKGVCGPYKIAAPKSLKKVPVWYESRCGADSCSLVMASCVDISSIPVVRNVDCAQGRCIAVTDVVQKECDTASDCVKNSCCHATTCVPIYSSPNCEGKMCTMNCEPGTLDCGGSCGCVDGQCVGILPTD